jgi:hypothetical protein
MMDEIMGIYLSKIDFQRVKMVLRRSTVWTFRRWLVDQYYTSAHIAFPMLYMSGNMLLSNEHITFRRTIYASELFSGRSTVWTFRRWHHAVIYMPTFLTFPSYKSIHTVLK